MNQIPSVILFTDGIFNTIIRKMTIYKYLLTFALVTAGTPVINAQTDVTAKYLTNPSFELDDLDGLTVVNNNSDGLRGWRISAPQGWSLSGIADPTLIVTTDCYTDNNFGKVTTLTNGNQAFYMRVGWVSGASSLTQKVTLPAGSYRLTADIRSAYNGSANSAFTLCAGDQSLTEDFAQGSAGYFANAPWSTVSVDFMNTTAGEVTISLDVTWKSGGSCVMIDNVRLYEIPVTEPTEDPTEKDVESPTEGKITHDFVAETDMQDDLMRMLAAFSKYIKNDYQACDSPNSLNEACGCFMGENTMANDEKGVRTNADLSMISAFLVRYGRGKVTLPEGVTWEDLEMMARNSLVFAYSTHKANKLKTCKGGNYWGSVSNSDHVWESSLWAMSVAYSAFFQWDKLSETQKGYIRAMLIAECNYELERSIPTGFSGDTKAEENGWEADILAATLGLFPDDDLAPRWFNRLREFAINSYSHASDKDDDTVIDPDYDNTTVSDLYRGNNLYDDYTLQNHNLFHTSYQNVVMQELGEAALALRLFQKGLYGTEKWKTNALMHNNREVMENVLNKLALADGELAMPNGNDWSLFLFDQITSYSTMACFLKDPDALMLENMAYKFIKARQQTTADGSWLLNADVGARRMGVQGHRVMMTWLMHNELSTADLAPTKWEDFREAHSDAEVLKAQNVVRASTKDRFSCSSWSSGLKSYTGYFTPNTPDNNKIIVPFRANNTGNLIGWYDVPGKTTDASPVVSGIYNLNGDAWTMNGELNTNQASLNNRFAIYSTPGNALIYIDYVRSNADITIKREFGGMLAISTDPFMKEKRTLYYGDGKHLQSDGKKFVNLESGWVNIDNSIGMASTSGKKIGFGLRANNNSISTSQLYPMYASDNRQVKSGDIVDRRNLVYYSNVDAETTQRMAEGIIPLTANVNEGWNGVIAPDPDGSRYMVLANFASAEPGVLSKVTVDGYAPVFSVPTEISEEGSSAKFYLEQNNSVSGELCVYLKGSGLTAVLDQNDPRIAYISNSGSKSSTADASIFCGSMLTGSTVLAPGKCVKATVSGGKVVFSDSTMPQTSLNDLTEGYTDVTDRYIPNPSFEKDKTYGVIGSGTVSAGEFNPCYINDVKPANSNFINILPVEGWSQNAVPEGESAYCRMYSMPYGSNLYCVSVAGNYAAQCPPYVADDTDGDRCLTVLNSWAKGDNVISSKASLPAGTYRMLLNMRYECPNEESNDGRTIKAGGNENSSLTGVTIDGIKDFRYPTESAQWNTMCWDFTLENETDVEFSIGYSTSDSKGAANNTLLYADNLRLLAKKGTGIKSIDATDAYTVSTKYYSLDGVSILRPAPGTVVIAHRILSDGSVSVSKELIR